MRAESPATSLPRATRMPVLRVWWTAIRSRTLSLAITPVLVGTALAWADGMALQLPAFLTAMACAVLIQIGTNLHNDVRDFERGNDRPDRVGPLRVTAAGWVSARTMHRATAWTFGLAALLGMYLVALGGWPILLAGVASLLAGWAYSGGPRPVSHTPLGEVFVLVFFGWVAVLGSYWLQGGHLSLNAWLCGTVLGLPAAAVLLVNNYRDLEDDLRSGRQTLVALLGRDEARIVFASMVLLPFALILVIAGRGQMGALLALLAMPYGIQLTRRLRHNTSASSLNALLAATARISLLLGVLLSIGVLL
jgi:1,4-dihydroxy-2-naphthoate octaprenyltransferase